MIDFQVVPSIFGGWIARDMAGNALKHPKLAYGTLPPRHKTAEKAAEYGRQVLRALERQAR